MRRRMYNFLCLKLRDHWTESHQISTRCTEMIADYSAEIKIAIIIPICLETPTWRMKIVVKLRKNRSKNLHFNGINSKITGRKFTKFGHNVAWLLPLNLLKVDLRSANPLSNAEANSKGLSMWRLQNLPYLTGCHRNVPWATTKLMSVF